MAMPASHPGTAVRNKIYLLFAVRGIRTPVGASSTCRRDLFSLIFIYRPGSFRRWADFGRCFTASSTARTEQRQCRNKIYYL
jgi:hypothetical protein